MSDPYTVLELQRDASTDEIKAAFRRLAKIYHPDLNPGNAEAEAKFKEISAAYEALNNPQKNQGQSSHYQETNWGSVFDEPFFQFRGGNIRDIEELLRQHAEQQRARTPNSHITTQCAITLEQIFHGCDIQMNLNMPGSPSHNIRVPPGITENQRIRIPGAGRADNPNMPPGDLFVVIREQSHDRFVREGADLVTEARIDALDAILGTEIIVMGIDGRSITVTIPPGTQYGGEIIIVGEGMPVYNAAARGNLRVFTIVEIPRALTERHIALVKALSEKLPTNGDIG